MLINDEQYDTEAYIMIDRSLFGHMRLILCKKRDHVTTRRV